MTTRTDRLMLTPLARLAIHMNAARPPGRLPPARRYRVWTWWVQTMLMALATAAVAVVVWQILRRGL